MRVSPLGSANVEARAATWSGGDAGAADEALMSRYAKGDVAAFEELYERHERSVYRFLMRSVGIAATADDLVQEVWISVIRNAGSYEPRAKFTTWLYQIARSRLIDHWRSRDRLIVQRISDDDDTVAGALLEAQIAAPSSEQPEAVAMNRAQAQALVQAVEALPVNQREAFVLHAEAGLTLVQISAICGASVETVKSRFRYACKKLREHMAAWENA